MKVRVWSSVKVDAVVVSESVCFPGWSCSLKGGLHHIAQKNTRQMQCFCVLCVLQTYFAQNVCKCDVFTEILSFLFIYISMK